jgi:4-alpha-glucanotransferase
MNRLGTGDGNWGWQLAPGQLPPEVAEKLQDITETYGRDLKVKGQSRFERIFCSDEPIIT